MPVETDQIGRRRLRRRVADAPTAEPARPAPAPLAPLGSRVDRRSLTWWVFDTLLAGAAVLAMVSVVVEYRDTHAEQPTPTVTVSVRNGSQHASHPTP